MLRRTAADAKVQVASQFDVVSGLYRQRGGADFVGTEVGILTGDKLNARKRRIRSDLDVIRRQNLNRAVAASGAIVAVPDRVIGAELDIIARRLNTWPLFSLVMPTAL